jgi:glycosyltransferase involved in cell wall biosynthesis
MKILIFNTLYYPNQKGGAEKSVQFIAEGLLSQGHEPVVVCTSDHDYLDYVNGVKVYYVNTNNIYWAYTAKEQKSYKKPFWHLIDSYNLFAKKKIEKIIQDEKPNVVHTNNLTGFSDIVWKIAKDHDIKIIHTLRDYYQLCPKSTMFEDGQNCKGQCTSCKMLSIPKKKNSELVDVVVGVSKFILDKHLRYGYFKNAKIKTNIFNPVPLPLDIKKTDSKKIRLGLVGLMSKSKGTEFVLHNFIKHNNNNIELHIYGSGVTQEYENFLKDRFKNENIYFHGFKKVSEIYSNIDILIISSLWHEPFPRTLIEAMSFRTLVLATNRGGTSEMVHDGKNGYIFDPDIEGDFEEKLQCTLEMFKQNAFEFDLSHFGFDAIIQRYIEVYA